MKVGTKWWSLALAMLMALGLVALVSGCSGDIGDTCEYHSDCSERCVEGGDFPGGMCTYSCDDFQDCPGGTACIDRKDGVCMMQCDEDRDCPGGYECERQDRHGERGEERVCIGN